jgi:hypothetical protein
MLVEYRYGSRILLERQPRCQCGRRKQQHGSISDGYVLTAAMENCTDGYSSLETNAFGSIKFAGTAASKSTARVGIATYYANLYAHVYVCETRCGQRGTAHAMWFRSLCVVDICLSGGRN